MLAADLCYGCQMSEYSDYDDPAWVAKYIEMHRYQPKGSSTEKTSSF